MYTFFSDDLLWTNILFMGKQFGLRKKIILKKENNTTQFSKFFQVFFSKAFELQFVKRVVSKMFYQNFGKGPGGMFYCKDKITPDTYK